MIIWKKEPAASERDRDEKKHEGDKFGLLFSQVVAIDRFLICLFEFEDSVNNVSLVAGLLEFVRRAQVLLELGHSQL